MKKHPLPASLRWSAFTLVELMAALAIVAVLILCISSGVSSAVEKAQRASCLSNMRTIASSVLTYASENDMNYPQTENGAWDVPLISYLDGTPSAANPIMKCPADKRPLVRGTQFSRSYSLNVNLPSKTIQAQEPSKTIMLAEWYTGEDGPGGASRNYQYSPNYSVVEYHMEGVPIEYHKTVSNFVFCDGHAESYEPRATIVPVSYWSMR